jgi:hypothetical protein
MKNKKWPVRWLIGFLAVMMVAPPWIAAQGTGGGGAFPPERLEALVAPIALYPDSLLTQVLMASTYPLELVQAARWAKANPGLKGDQLDAALQQQNWDPSVTSLVNFPQVLEMMSQKLDWTQQLGDAVLSQQAELMDAVQRLRARAQAAGNLQSTQEQQVIVKEKTIVIEPAQPDVVYVPTYNPVVVYGAWPYPAYPPPPVYYPGYYPGAAAAVGFAAGVGLGFAWGYAWGHCDWHGGDININVKQNFNYNKNINRDKYSQRPGQGGSGTWKHDPDHRKGVSYRDQGTAQKFGKGDRGSAAGRQDFRGFDRGQTGQLGQRGERPGAGGLDRGGAGRDTGRFDRAGASGGREGAFSGMGRGSEARSFSERGLQSRAGGFGGGGGGFHGGGGGFHGGGGRRR